MAINLYGPTLHNGLFDCLGRAFRVQSDINVSRGATIPADVQNLLNTFALLPAAPAVEVAGQPVIGAIVSYQTGATGALSTMQTFAAALITAIAANDRTQPDSSLKTALLYVIAQMQAQGVTVNRSNVTVSAGYGGANAGDGILYVSKVRGDGLVQENAIGETFTGAAQNTSATASINLTGQLAASGSLGQDWPMGSGASTTVTAVDANSGVGSLLTNGGMETQAAIPNVPDSWLLPIGTPGTTCGMTITQVQKIAISGSPSSGNWAVLWQNSQGKTAATSPIAWNATAASVQSALRLIAGLSLVTVTSSGSAPNLTFTITMAGVAGDSTQFSILNFLNMGAITPSISTHGTTQVFAGGAAFYFLSNGSELTTIQQQLTTLQPSTAYAVSLWACADVVPGAGVITVDLVDGVSGLVINDAQGVANSISFNAASLLTGFQHLSALQAGGLALRTPATLPSLVYLRIRVSTAVTNGRKVFIDNVALAAMTSLYSGGPAAIAFTGSRNFAVGDAFSILVNNDRAGILREWCNRNLNMASLGLLFPSSASPTIPDTIITPASVLDGFDFSQAVNSMYVPLL